MFFGRMKDAFIVFVPYSLFSTLKTDIIVVPLSSSVGCFIEKDFLRVLLKTLDIYNGDFKCIKSKYVTMVTDVC